VFQLTYVRRELRRRLGRTLLTALGLAAGVGLVIGIVGVSQGLTDAQSKVLAPLRSVGTDVLVTRVAGATTVSSTSGATGTTVTTQPADNGPGGGQGGGGFFFGGGGGGGRNGGGPGGANSLANLNDADAQALLQENESVITDLSKLGQPGDKFVHDFFLPATLISFPDAAVSSVQQIPGVTKAVGGLSLLASHQTGTVPKIVDQIQTGGETINTTVRPAPLSDAERQAMRACLQTNGAFPENNTPTTQAGGTPPTTEAGGGGGGGGFRRGGNDAAFQQCLPERFKEFQASVTTPIRAIQQVVNPPSTDITTSSYNVAGVDPASPDEGLVTKSQVTSGRFINPGATDEVLVNVAYANKKSLKLGDTLPINGTDYHIVGLVSPTLSGNTADVYFPLSTLQTLSSKTGRVNEVLVKVSDASKVDSVAAAIRKQLPGAQVVTTKELASQVTGSLADTKKLADRLGGALAVIVLIAAFAIAMLLTLSSIGKRVREIGTLRAIGWSKGMVVRQILAETIGIGVVGAILGSIVGIGASAAVGAFSPSLTATSGGVPGVGDSSVARLFGSAAQSAAKTTSTVHLHAPLHPSTFLLGCFFAILGGVLAGMVGGWRAARLAPAEALRDIG
jgi:ABC-type antimicrobial peptide transport system permease subunit